MNAIVPEHCTFADPILEQHKKDVNRLLQVYNTSLKAIKLRAALVIVLRISALGNKLLQDNKLSNKLLTEDPDRCHAVVGLALDHLHLLANLLSPYMPGTAKSIFRQLGLQDVTICIPDTWTGDNLKPGHIIGAPELLFSVIPLARAEGWREAFGGEQFHSQKTLEAEKAGAKKAAKEKEKEKKRLKKTCQTSSVAGLDSERSQDSSK